MEMQNFIEESKVFLAHGKISDSIDSINKIFETYEIHNKEIQHRFITISGTFFSNRTRFINGTINNEAYNIYEAKTIANILHLTEELSKIDISTLFPKQSNTHTDSTLSIINHFSSDHIFHLIKQIIDSDAKILDIQINLESKQGQKSKENNVQRVKELSTQIELLEKDLIQEKENYKSLQIKYEELESEFFTKTTDKNSANEDYIHEYMQEILSLKESIEQLRIEHTNNLALLDFTKHEISNIKNTIDNLKISQEEKLLTILQYMDDLNRKYYTLNLNK